MMNMPADLRNETTIAHRQPTPGKEEWMTLNLDRIPDQTGTAPPPVDL